jgi:hypothetical protein
MMLKAVTSAAFLLESLANVFRQFPTVFHEENARV